MKTSTTFQKGHKGHQYWLGKKRSKETIEKIREKLKGKPVAII